MKVVCSTTKTLSRLDSGAGGGNRTHTPLAGPRILSPVRLPVSPPRHEIRVLIVSMIYADCGLASAFASARLSSRLSLSSSEPQEPRWAPKRPFPRRCPPTSGQNRQFRARGVSTDPVCPPPPGRAPSASACAPYREIIADPLARARNAVAIWHDLVDVHGFPGRYASVRRFAVKLRGSTPAEARVVITTAPGKEGQVDCGDGPMVRDRGTASTGARASSS